MENCSKCGSQKIIPNVKIIDRANAGAETNLTVVVYENPGGLPLLKGQHRGHLKAMICGDCGYTELLTTQADELWEAYQKAQQA